MSPHDRAVTIGFWPLTPAGLWVAGLALVVAGLTISVVNALRNRPKPYRIFGFHWTYWAGWVVQVVAGIGMMEFVTSRLYG